MCYVIIYISNIQLQDVPKNCLKDFRNRKIYLLNQILKILFSHKPLKRKIIIYFNDMQCSKAKFVSLKTEKTDGYIYVFYGLFLFYIKFQK